MFAIIIRLNAFVVFSDSPFCSELSIRNNDIHILRLFWLDLCVMKRSREFGYNTKHGVSP